jgi:hypothetical protein
MKFAMIISIIVLTFLLIGCATKTNNNQNLTGINENKSENQINIEQNITINTTTETPKGENNAENVTEQEPQAEENKTEPETPTDNENTNEPTPEAPEEPSVEPNDSCKTGLEQECTGPPWLPCIAKPGFNSQSKTIIFAVQNKLGYIIELISAAGYKEEEPWQCMTRCVAESAEVSFGEEFLGIDAQKVSPDETFEIRLKCSGVTDYLDQKFELTYSGNGTESTGYFMIKIK